MDDKKRAEQLLGKYLNARATPEEVKLVENWYDGFENNPVPEKEQKIIIGQRMFARIRQHLYPQVFPLSRLNLLRTAATILVICSIGIGYRQLNRQTAPVYLQIPQLTFSTKAGEKKTIVLNDGSEITLNALGRITYPVKFSASSREITLVEGEAFFKIAHDKRRPFKVGLPDQLYTQVLGTSFHIRAFKASGELNIAVNTGKVAVGNKNQVFGKLIKGEQITYNRKLQSAVISQVPAADMQIAFEGITLKQALHELEYIYTIKIDLRPLPLGNQGCTETFNSRESPEEIIGVICSLYNLKFTTSSDHKSFKIYKI